MPSLPLLESPLRSEHGHGKNGGWGRRHAGRPLRTPAFRIFLFRLSGVATFCMVLLWGLAHPPTGGDGGSSSSSRLDRSLFGPEGAKGPTFHNNNGNSTTGDDVDPSMLKRIQELETEIGILRAKQSQPQQQQQQQQAGRDDPTSTAQVDPQTQWNHNGIRAKNSMYPLCHSLPATWDSWTNVRDVILAATQDRQLDDKFVLREQNGRAMQFITPRLHRSDRSLPRNFQQMEGLMRKVQARYDYLHQRNHGPITSTKDSPPPPPPPIRIVVSGGSVTEGHSCKTDVKAVYGRRCAWPYRLERLINNLAGGELVTVINGARGGSNSQMGRVLMRYGLAVPPAIRKQDAVVDIVINGHSVNDQHILTIRQAEDRNVSLEEYILDMAQNFTREVMSSHDDDDDENYKLMCNSSSSNGTVPSSPPPPMLLWLDDYLGNEHRHVLKLTGLSKSIHVLSNYYGFGVASYADAVRDVVYGDTRERLLSPNWHADNGQMVREVHPGAFMHACVTYVWLHYFWTMANHVCSRTGTGGEEAGSSLPIDYHDDKVPWEDRHNGTMGPWPRPRPPGLPPRLTSDLSLEDISDVWKKNGDHTTSRGNQRACINGTAAEERNVCPFRWTTGLEKDFDIGALESDTIKLFEPHIRQSTSWELTQRDFGNGRFGWAAYHNATVVGHQPLMVLEFPFDGIQTVALFIAKNIDPMWKDSLVNVTVLDATTNKVLKSQLFRGYSGTIDPLSPDQPQKRPNKRRIKIEMTNRVYLEEMDLSDVTPMEHENKAPSNGLRVELRLVAGFGFKFMGLTLCRFPVIDTAPLPINNQ